MAQHHNKSSTTRASSFKRRAVHLRRLAKDEPNPTVKGIYRTLAKVEDEEALHLRNLYKRPTPAPGA